MKSLNQYITEKLKVSKKQYNYYPKTKEELNDLIRKRIKEEGNNVNLNDIDVSNITDMSGLFSITTFNGDISGWDVSNVTDMWKMFYICEKFEGKGLENWDVSNVTNMYEMFKDCEKLDCNLSKWDISNVKYYANIFFNCPIKDEYKPKFR